MGFGHKYFFIEDNDRIVRVPAARFVRIYDGQETLPRYAGQRMRCAHVMVQLENRALTGWHREWYHLVPFDSTGKVNKAEDMRGAGLVTEALASVVLPRDDENAHPTLVDSRGKFAQREFDGLFRWEPDLKLRTKILDLALGRTPSAPPRPRARPMTLVGPPRLDPASVARRWMREIWADRNLAGFDQLHAPDFIDRSPSGRGTDRAAYRSGIEELFQAFPDFAASTEDLVVDEALGKVAVRWTATGTHQAEFLGHPPTGRRITFRGIEILRIENGKIVERWGEWDGLDLVQELGA